MKAIYVQSVIELLHAGHEVESVLSGLRSTMEKRGHNKLYAAVVRAVKRQLERGDTSAPTVTVRNLADKAQFTAAIAADMATLQAKTEPTVIVDETIIGGYTAAHDHAIIDRSFKNALLNLYRKIAR